MNERMSDKELDAYCQEWVWWCYTRRFYMPRGAQNILARMQPAKVKEPPNARNSPDMQYFNMAVHAMAEMSEHAEGFACFRLMYIEQTSNIKKIAFDKGFDRKTYYNRARVFARRAVSLGRSLAKVGHTPQIDIDEITENV